MQTRIVSERLQLKRVLLDTLGEQVTSPNIESHQQKNKKKKKQKKVPSSSPSKQQQTNWVQCEKCDMWHELPEGITSEELAESWNCSLINWTSTEHGCTGSIVTEVLSPCSEQIEEVHKTEHVVTQCLVEEDGFPEGTLRRGDIVIVSRHFRNNKEIEAGGGRILSRSKSDNGSITYDVQYVFRKLIERDIPSEYISLNTLSMTNDEDFRSALAVKDDIGLSSTIQQHFVRRSVRHAGTDQLSRPNVRDLLSRLERDDSNDTELVVLRLKNWLEADTNSQVLTRIFELIKKSKNVQALYVQNMEKGMDDKRLAQLSAALRVNNRIWALNVGENFKISKAGWEQFADELQHTGVTHIYAGSESTVHGELKVKMRDMVRNNRTKHDLYCAKSNLNVIMQIGQMWWNPRNSKIVQSYKINGGKKEDEFHVHDKIVFKRDGINWEFGMIQSSFPYKVQILSSFLGEELIELDLVNSKLSTTSKFDVVLLQEDDDNSEFWPALYFDEPGVVVLMKCKSDKLCYQVVKQEKINMIKYENFSFTSSTNENWTKTMELVENLFIK